MEYNDLGQPVGRLLDGWQAPAMPPHVPLSGEYCRLEPLALRHAPALFAANGRDADGAAWTYLPYGPFESFDAYRTWIEEQCASKAVQLYAIVEAVSGEPMGVAGYLRADPQNGVIEIGHVKFAPAMQRTRLATEAIYLLIAQVFALGYRRCEWKCNALNEASRRAALRLGFSFEGIFRQLLVVKGRNRDTAWFSIIDSEWPEVKAALTTWLAPENFDEDGRQRQSLQALRAGSAASDRR